MAKIYGTRESKEITLLNSITSTAAINYSNAEDVSGFSSIALRLSGTAIDTDASATFTVEVSDDASSWVAYNLLIDNVTNANTQTITRVASKNIASNSDIMLFFTPEAYVKYARVACDIYSTATTSGNFSAILLANTA